MFKIISPIKCALCGDLEITHILACGCVYCTECYNNAISFSDSCLSCNHKLRSSLTIDLSNEDLASQIKERNTEKNNERILSKLRVSLTS